jgi:hypothetical protein
MADELKHAAIEKSDIPPRDAERTPADATTEAPWFDWTNELRFEWYMQRRNGYSSGARDSYQRYDQTIATVAAGAIVLSITFLKDIGYTEISIPFLYASWIAFLAAGGASLISLRTSADCDIERLHQLERLRATGKCNEEKAQRLGTLTVKLNHVSISAFVVGVLLMMIFAFTNYSVFRKPTPQVATTQKGTASVQPASAIPAKSSRTTPGTTTTASSAKHK